MKRLALTSAVVFLLLCSGIALAAEKKAPGDDRLKVNPIPAPGDQNQEDRELIDILSDYIGNRFSDLADIVTLKFGWGTQRSIGFQLRLIYPLQIGAGIFEGWTLAIDRGCVGTMKEVEVEGGLSIFYPTYIARKVQWQNEEAKRRGVFIGDVGEKAEVTVSDLKMYDDGNQGWLTSTVQAQLPCLPKFEITFNWGEIPDFFLSFLPIDGLRVPPPFYKQDGPVAGENEKPERIPAPSIFWHGQEKYEKYD